MSDSEVQPETSAECSLRDRVLLALARADGQDWSSIAEASRHTIEIMYGKQVDAVLAVRDDVLAECERQYRAKVDEVAAEMTRAEAAEAEVARLRETVGRVEARVAAWRDRSWSGWVAAAPFARAISEALAPRESAPEAPRTRDGEQGGER